MSDAREKARPSVSDPFGSGFDGFAMPSDAGAIVPIAPGAGAAADRAMGMVITAQRVAVKRNLPAILAEARAIAAGAGGAMYYSIPFKDRKSGQTTYVEGPSIKCAMAAVSAYGNCSIEALPAQETAQAWTFMARFVDYEKGLTVSRSFQQRKGQDTGMGDAARRMDMVFQIGQSKAIRNVIVGALPWLCDEMMAEAKKGIVNRINGNVDGARAWILEELYGLQIEPARVERIVGRPAAKWLATDMAKLFTQISSIKDGFADADEIFPAGGQAAEDLREANAAEVQDENKKADDPKPPAAERKPRRQPEKEAPPAAAAPEAVRPAADAPAQEVAREAEAKPTPPPAKAAARPEPEADPGDDGEAEEMSFV